MPPRACMGLKHNNLLLQIHLWLGADVSRLSSDSCARRLVTGIILLAPMVHTDSYQPVSVCLQKFGSVLENLVPCKVCVWQDFSSTWAPGRDHQSSLSPGVCQGRKGRLQLTFNKGQNSAFVKVLPVLKFSFSPSQNFDPPFWNSLWLRSVGTKRGVKSQGIHHSAT